MTKRMIFPIILGLTGIAILLYLGTWQVQRMAWKNTMLAQISSRIAAEPADLPAKPNPEFDNRLSVRVKALIGFDEAHVIFSTKRAGPGFLVIVPALTKPDGRRVLIDMGFVPEAQKKTVRKPQTVTIVGNILWPNEVDSYTPDPNMEKNIWFARDAPKLAHHFGTESFLIVARTIETGDYGTTPQPIGLNIPNNHMEYAITWFSLALVWFGMTLYLLYRIKQKTV
ncbi:MAG: SURF1 family protein [Proteobacteria bacterium]|nr:SURF1 family protein [Pseudomonadota bacterium]